jgi:hypothetical protein
MPNTVPELTNYAANAYNAKDGNFLSKPVFALTYNQGRTINWGPDGAQKQLPDQISASTTTTHYELMQTLLLETQSDYDRSFSASANVEYTGVAFSGSIQSSFFYHGNLFSSTSSKYALNFYLQSVLRFERIQMDRSALDNAFIAAIQSLPLDISSIDNQQKYFDFFDSYGTHYTRLGTMGGTIVMETEIDDRLLVSHTSLEVSAAISAGYQGVIASGSLDVNAAYKSSSFLSQNRSSMNVTLHVLGGSYAPDKSISSWVDSIYSTPSLLLDVPTLQKTHLTKLEAISKLVSIAGGNQAIAGNIESLLHIYMMQDDYKDGLLTSPQDLAFDNVYRAQDGDGFVMATIQQTPGQTMASIHAFSGADDDPTEVIATASQQYVIDRDKHIPYASLTMPVVKDTFYFSQKVVSAGNPITSLQFVGFGNTAQQAPGMSPWQSVPVNTDLIAKVDGFVVAYVDWNNQDGARSYIQGQQMLSNNQYTTVAGASQHFYTGSTTGIPTNSFCMPIRKDTRYRVDFTSTVPELRPTSRAFFISLPEALVFFQPFQRRTEERVYQALTDGFLVAYLFKVQNGDRGYVDLYAHLDDNNLIQLGKRASTSIHYFVNTDIFVPYSTAMIPVPKNAHYTARFTKTALNPGVQLLWMPLGIQQ